MKSIRELREELQAPRRAVDTWYGRYVMRSFSIYISAWALKRGWSPNQMTSLSLAAGVSGAVFLSLAWWGWGILFVNLWYLLDHSDGEIARASGKSSPSGYFYDTVVNFIVQPLFFLGLGAGLLQLYPGFLTFGLIFLACFGCFMLMVIPMCEDAVILSLNKKTGILPAEALSAAAEPSALPLSPLKRIFSFWHLLSTFPNVLALLTGLSLLLFFSEGAFRALLYGTYLFYAVSFTMIWILQLYHKVSARRLDDHPTLKKRP